MSSTGVPDPTLSSDGGGGGGGGGNNTELIIAVVALIISVFAFIIAILQALQQYFASATGFSSCSDAVIGKWSQFAKRVMVWSEFRFEVQFEVPVIFVARPENHKGPLGDDKLVTDEARKIIRLDGSPSNFNYTTSMAEFDEQAEKSRTQLVHTADNEKATWYALLMAVCRMEKESRDWQEKKSAEWRTANGPRPPLDSSTPPNPPHSNHSLLVCMQRKRRTWDSMPKDFAKPYATTTISHLVEIASMLGIHWRQFDLNNDQYRAQGNGFVLYGSYVENLGVTFTFQKQGPTWFEKDRVIPHYNVKQFCFGMAPTIFSSESKVYADEAKGVESLQLGSLAEIAKTLVVFGCDIKTVNYFRKNLDHARHSHLFPIPFEILGMVGEMQHIQDTVFRMLPNPIAFYWDPSTFSLPTLLNEFLTLLKTLHEGPMKDSQQITRILEWADSDNKFPLLRAPGSTLDVLDEDVNGGNLINGLNHLRSGVLLCDNYFKQTNLSVVKKIVRTHIQEVMDILHEKTGDDTSAKAQDKKDSTVPETKGSPITILDIDSANADEKESLLAEMYFDRVRPNVARIVCKQDFSSKQRRARRDSIASGNGATTKIKPDKGVTEHQINEAWCTLMFRMLCWLQLHDFHKKDIQLSKSDAYASRIPVYIV